VATGAAGIGIAAVLAAGAPAAAVVAPAPRPTAGPIVPGPVIPGPIVPGPIEPGPIVPGRPLAWEVELKDTWRSPTWSQPAGRITAAVHLDCGDVIGIRLPQYHVRLVAEDGRFEPAVMPTPVACGVTHRFTWVDVAGKYHLRLDKATAEGATLRGKAAVVTP